MKKKIPEASNVTPSDFIIIGGAGDLSLRKIIPALFWRFLDNQINSDTSVIICVHKQINIDQLKSKLIPHCNEAIAKDIHNKEKWVQFIEHQIFQFLKFELFLNQYHNRQVKEQFLK